MDSGTPKRRRKRESAGNPAAAGEEAAQGAENSASEVPDGAPEGDALQGLQEDSLEVPFHDPRAAIAEGLAALLTPTQVTFLLQEVLAITKKVSVEFDCTHCGKHFRTSADVPDAKAVVSSLTDLINHGFGRPDVAKMERDMIEFRRFVDMSEWEARDDEDADQGTL